VAVIERLAQRKGARGQFRFAGEAKTLIPAREEFVLAKSHRGLHVLARNEADLRMPLERLHATYGSDLVIREQKLGEPVMEVRIGLEKRYLPEVRSALWRRNANASEEYDGPDYCVLRFEAPASDLLGLPVELADLTSGRLSHQIVLTRYQ
jgi:translation elongation factor EF-G